MAIRDTERTVVLLDEISWMAAFDDTFSDTLKIAWDNHLKKHDQLILVVCGSVSSWIKDEIIDNRAFYGRRSLDLVVPELSLRESVQFWRGREERINTRAIFDILAVTGGVPRYLEEMNPSLTAQENLRRMCFVPKVPLREDFGEMFDDVIAKQPKLVSKVLRTLVDASICAVEIKRQTKIGLEVIDEMKSRVSALPRPADASLRIALVYDGELSRSVESAGYFDAIVPFRTLCGL